MDVRTSFVEFLARPAAPSPAADVERVRALLKPNERIVLIGRGPWRMMRFPITLAGFDVAFYVFTLLRFRDAFTGDAVVLLITAAIITTNLLGVFAWILRGHVVIITDRRVILAAGIARLKALWTVPLDEIETVSQRSVNFLGTLIEPLSFHFKDGTEKKLGAKTFTRLAS